MGAIRMMAANNGINRKTGYRHEHKKKKSLERHLNTRFLQQIYQIQQRVTGAIGISADFPHGKKGEYQDF
jgi:hypothetical protein